MTKRGKKFTEAAKLVDRTAAYSVKEAIELAKKLLRQTSTQQLKWLSVLVSTLVRMTSKSVEL